MNQPLGLIATSKLALNPEPLYDPFMVSGEICVFQGFSFKVLSAGVWDPSSFGLVDIEIIKTSNGLEVFLSSGSEVPVQFEIDSYLWTGTRILLRTNSIVKWILQTTN
jgi:hypothetical protein